MSSSKASRGAVRVLTATTMAVLVVALGAPTVGATAPEAKAPGAGAAPGGTAMNTQAAFDNPQCNRDYGAYGRFDFTLKGSGAVCVAALKEGADNGGATAPGVTRDSITVGVVTANAQQDAANKMTGAGNAIDRATGQDGKWNDAFADIVAAYEHAYQTWGRKVRLEFVESSGSDEASQRADALAVKAFKPFAVIDGVSTGLDVFESEIAKAKIPVTGYAASTEKALKQAPYRWGQSDSQAAAINMAEFAGKQLVKKDAEFAGDAGMHKNTRAFGAIYTDGVIDMGAFDKAFAKFGGKVAQAFPYTSNGSTLGDPAAAQEAAPVIVQKLKATGVTSVLMFTDVAMTKAVLEQATKQEYRPEWLITANQYQDLAILARNYDQSQWAHAFGISNLFPASVAGTSSIADPVTWYWGPSRGTFSIQASAWVGWLMSGIQTAGSKLTAKTFAQGLFATPAQGGAAEGDPVSFQTAWGKTAGLPYDEYMQLGTDFAPVWWDSDTDDASQLSTTLVGTGVEWYLGNAKRFRAGSWPTRPFTFFDKTGAVVKFPTSPTPQVPNPCTGCPSSGGAGTPGYKA
jgi:hypothetical protein